MAVLETVARNAACNGIVDLVDGGAGNGKLVFETSGDAEVATISFGATAFGNAATGVATLQGVPLSDTTPVGGTVAQASLYDGATTPAKILEATVATTGAEINLSSLVIATADTVQLTSLTVTVPAS